MMLHDDRCTAWLEVRERLVRRKQCDARLLVLAAHPDDESIGASVLLPKFTSSVAYLTDGASRDSRLWTGGSYASREEYATLRRAEAGRALQLAMVPAARVLWLGGADQEAVTQIGELTQKLAALLVELKPDVLVTHPYEGGHPDHDAAALIAHTSLRQVMENPPQLAEMTSYHARNGSCVTGEFLPCEDLPEFVIELSDEERNRKQKMLAAHESQQVVLGRFRTDRELFRPAPDYDFSKPPHPGKLWYECMGWAMTGERWRQLAQAQIANRCDGCRATHADDRAQRRISSGESFGIDGRRR